VARRPPAAGRQLSAGPLGGLIGAPGGFSMERNLRCSFCGKSEHQVDKLVGGPSVYICDACVGIAYDIMRRSGPPPATGAQRAAIASRLCVVLSGLRSRFRGSSRAALAW
jgi:hypothetical protein